MPHSKTLFLLRHAKSSWDDPSLDDIDRPLNKRGKRDAPEMGRRLAEYGVKPEIIVSSPALRAFKTAEKVSEGLGFEKKDILIDERVYSWDSDAVLNVINSLDDKYKSAMIVFHNPAITDLVNELSDARIDNVPTCGLATVSFDTDKWSAVKKGKGKLLSFDYPKRV
jgi:phosphohistidine phosphatase